MNTQREVRAGYQSGCACDTERLGHLSLGGQSVPLLPTLRNQSQSRCSLPSEIRVSPIIPYPQKSISPVIPYSQKSESVLLFPTLKNQSVPLFPTLKISRSRCSLLSEIRVSPVDPYPQKSESVPLFPTLKNQSVPLFPTL